MRQNITVYQPLRILFLVLHSLSIIYVITLRLPLCVKHVANPATKAAVLHPKHLQIPIKNQYLHLIYRRNNFKFGHSISLDKP